MRVPNINTYYTATYRLGNLTENLKNANEVVSTQKRINEISDDPLGLSQTLSLNNAIGTLEQIERNVITGKSWLETGEDALDSINNLILEAKSEAIRLSNDSVTSDERTDAVERIDSMIEQIVSIGNTQVNGNYIFGGTDTNIPPFTYDRSTEPDQVIYTGNSDPFEIRSDKNSQVQVGRDGKETFWDDQVEINSTNNAIVFKEDNGHGSASERVVTAVIPDGLYTKDDLETAVKNVLNAASAKEGYGVTYLVDYNEETQKFSIREDGTFPGYLRTEFKWESGGDAYINNVSTSNTIDPDDVTIGVNTDALTIGTPEPHGTEPFTLIWQGNDTWKIVNNPGYTITPEIISGTAESIEIDLNESGTPDIRISLDGPVNKKGDFISFEIIPAKGDHSVGHEIGFNGDNLIQSSPVSDTQAQYITELEFTDGTNDRIFFREVNSTGGATPLSIDLSTAGGSVIYTDMDALAKTIETKMEVASAAGPNQVQYNVSYDARTSRFKIQEEGAVLDEFHLEWSLSNAASTLGFYPLDDSTVYPASDIPLDRTIVINDANNTFSFGETALGSTSETVTTAIVANNTYRNATSFAAAVEASLELASTNLVDYSVTYNPATNRFNIQDVSGTLSSFSLDWAGSSPGSDTIAKSLGFSPDVDFGNRLSYDGNTAPVIMTIDSFNKWIEFAETDADGNRVTASIEIPEGDYTDTSHVASVIQTQMNAASYNKVDYVVVYDSVEQEFVFKKGANADIASFEMLWQSGGYTQSNAADLLGFSSTNDDRVKFSISDREIINITIDGTNDKLDFIEITKEDGHLKTSRLTADIPQKNYTSHEQLAKAVEKAMEEESLNKGNRVDYTVAWDDVTRKFTIKENGHDLEEFQLQWNSGDNAPVDLGGTGQGIGSVLGFDSVEDDVYTAMESSREVEWGIFNTLIDLKQYLSENDRDGIERSIDRLEISYDNMTSKIVDTGMKYSRLQVRETITSEVSLSLTERRSNIEDADIIESIMNLQNIETAYQAALSSTSKVLNISLVDYLR